MVNELPFRRRRRTAEQDGLSATPFPSGVRNVPVEATEAITPLVYGGRSCDRIPAAPGVSAVGWVR